MRVAVASDHAGFPLYEGTLAAVRTIGHEALGLNRPGPPDPGDDYTDFAIMVGEKLQRGECERGIDQRVPDPLAAGGGHGGGRADVRLAVRAQARYR